MESTEKIQRLPFLPTQTFQARPKVEIYRLALKRVFDLFLALMLLPFILPVLLLLIILIKIDSKGPAIYRSERIGKNGKKFNCLKLRTMCPNAEEKLDQLLRKRADLKEEYEKFCKLKDDPRITRVGRLLRTFSMDELPQIFNILRGDMSFVGPRPAFEKEIKKYYGSNFREYQMVRPGVTGLWQISGRNNKSFDYRVKMDSQYSKTLKFSKDIKILVKTIPAALSAKGAY